VFLQARSNRISDNLIIDGALPKLSIELSTGVQVASRLAGRRVLALAHGSAMAFNRNASDADCPI